MCTGHTVLPSHRHFPINVPIIWTVPLVKAKFICSFWKPSPHVWGRASPRSHDDLACIQVNLKGRLSSLGSTSCDLPGCGRLGAFKELPGVLLLAVIAVWRSYQTGSHFSGLLGGGRKWGSFLPRLFTAEFSNNTRSRFLPHCSTTIVVFRPLELLASSGV